jgi:sigma-B regulation protein RsbU (phosphoserine phosphatase)
VILSAVVIFIALRMASDPTLRRPQQMQMLAFGFLFVMLMRRIAQKLRIWVDRRFFREAVNLERVLGDLSEQVRGIVETGPLLETVTGSISTSLHVPRVTALLASNGDFTPVRSTGQAAPPQVKFSRSGALAEELQRTRHALRVSNVNPEAWVEAERERLDKLSAELLLPLTVKDRLLGFLSLGPKLSEEPYSATDVRLLQSVASQTGLALENSRLTEAVASEVAQRERLNRELEIAREVQERLFPQSGPKIDGLDYAGGCRPASSVGGDYYDFVPTCDGRLGIAIGDISGKGIPPHCSWLACRHPCAAWRFQTRQRSPR